MFVLANFISAAAQVLDILLQAYMFVIIAAVVLSWVHADAHNPLVKAVDGLAEMVLHRIRRILPFSLKFHIDISPFLALLGIFFMRRFAVVSLSEWAVRLKSGA
jgi:YggT family protein